MYRADLSALWPDGAREPDTLAVGWLDQDTAFPTARASETDLDLIWRHLDVPVDMERGFHGCPFCDFCGYRQTNRVTRHGITRGLGHYDIRVVGPDGRLFAAPGMIYHYMIAHDYAPPPRFLDALRTAPRPPDQAWFDHLDAHGIDYCRSP